jgi:hypothetical protein
LSSITNASRLVRHFKKGERRSIHRNSEKERL